MRPRRSSGSHDCEGWLFEDEGLISIGPEAERSLGWRNFMELTGIVTSDPEIVVRYGRAEVGRFTRVSFRSDHVGRTSRFCSVAGAGR